MKTYILAAGRFNKRIKLQSLTTTQDAAGEPVSAWADFADVWASINDVSGNEYISSAAVQNTVTTKVCIRARTGVVPSMRILYGVKTYQIEAVLEHDERSLLLMCSKLS